jgi:hypothetical protein
MGMTQLDDNIRSLIVDYDDSTCEAGFILKELSRNAFGARPLDKQKMSEALDKTCAEAKDKALAVIYSIERISANQ